MGTMVQQMQVQTIIKSVSVLSQSAQSLSTESAMAMVDSFRLVISKKQVHERETLLLSGDVLVY